MNILETIKNDPVLHGMYRTETYSFLCDTLTPAQLKYLATHPEDLEKWCDCVSEKIKEAISCRILSHDITPEIWGKVISQEVKTPPEPVTPNYTITIPYKVKGVKICFK